MIRVYEKEGITCVEGKLNGQIVYVFLVDGMLIDTGCQNIEKELIPFYEKSDFDLVVLTHSHEDHTGTASWIQEHKKVPLYIHPEGINSCSSPADYPLYRQHAWGIRKEFTASPLGKRIGSRHLEWEVIYTPGHADDHVAFYHRETGRLFSGDLFLGRNPKIMLDFESVPVLMKSIRTLLTYDFGPMFCSHAGYIDNGQQALQEKLDYLENLSGEVHHLHQQGLSMAEINERLFPKKHPLISISEGEFDSLHIVSSILLDQAN